MRCAYCPHRFRRGRHRAVSCYDPSFRAQCLRLQLITLHTFGPRLGMPDASPFVIKALVLLKMSGLPFKADPSGLRKAPKGKLPYIDDDGTIIGDSTFIRFHLEQRYGVDFDKQLTPQQRGLGWAFEKMCEDHLYWAIVDARWMDDANFDRGPRSFFDASPAFIRPIVINRIRASVRRTLRGQGFGRHSRAEIEMLAARDLDAIAAQLADQPFLLGAEPHATDATVFAFVASALCAHFETPIIASARSHQNLVAYRDRGMARWFPEMSSGGSAAKV